MDAMTPLPPETRSHDAARVHPRLAAAASQFVVARDAGDPMSPGCSIIAGYPWFADWGRDTMISLRGLLLTTGRTRHAGLVLQTWASAIQDGLLPNRFDDRTVDDAHYNTADASLWFMHAAHAYFEEVGGPSGSPWGDMLLEACLDIVHAHLAGTCPGIRVAADGLIEAGIEGEALTWMDARIDGVAVTPRIGKPVELSALWQSGLRLLSNWLPSEASRLTDAADAAAASFSKFWNDEADCCFDLLEQRDGHWVGNPQIRPNQIFAVSLPFSPLSSPRQRRVLEVVQRELLTPYGLRTLSPRDPDYCGRFTGDMRSRDTAYHNGTVWPWLIGPWCDAIRRTWHDPVDAEAMVADATASLLDSLDHGCVGQIAEIYDGDAPHEPHGCPAQAWSVAELLRASAPAPLPTVRPI